MRSTIATLAVLTAFFRNVLASPESSPPAPIRKRDSWGGSLSLGPTTAPNRIKEVSMIFVPGVAPSTQNGMLFLWPGISNGTGDLIQTTFESWPDNTWCGATPGQWCVRCSLFGSFGQIDGDASPANGTDEFYITYKRSDDGLSWTQEVRNYRTYALLSTLTHESGHMTGFGTGTECDSDCTGTISAQQYRDITITVEAVDGNFQNTLSVNGGVTYTGLSNYEGIYWDIGQIDIPAMQ